MNRVKTVHKVFWIAGVEYRKFFSLKHMLIMLFSFLFLGEYIIQKMIMISQETGLQINYLEPINLILSYSFYAMIIPLTFTVLLSDFPDKSSGGIFILVRLKRKVWFWGQLVFAVMVGVTYLGFLLIVSVIFVGNTGEFSLHWSSYMTDLYLEYSEIYIRNGRLFLEAGTVSHGTPAGVFGTSFVFMLLYFLTISQLFCLFKFLEQKRIGLFVNMGIIIFGAVAVLYIKKIKWFFPMAHSIFGIHFNAFYAQPECRLIYSMIYFVILNIMLILINGHLAGKCHIGDDGE